MAREKKMSPSGGPQGEPSEGGSLRSLLLDSWHPYAWITASVFVLYGQTLFFGLTLLDDNLLLVQKLAFFRDWASLPQLFTRDSFLGSGPGVYYRPLLLLSMMIDAKLPGDPLAVSHLFNMLYHSAASCLTLAFFARMGSREKAFLLSLVFALHPALAQAVAWSPGRTDILPAIFLLPAFLCFADFLDRGGWRPLALHLLLLGLGLLSKELAVAIVPACLLYALVAPNPRLQPAGSEARLGRVFLAALAWAALLGLWYLLRREILSGMGGYSFKAIAGSLVSNLPALLLYWGKGLLPLNLSTYPILADSKLLYGLAALVLIATALALTRGVDLGRVILGAGWFAIFLLPSFIYPERSITPVFFEFRLYLPLVGFLVAAGEVQPLRSFSLDNPRHRIGAVILLGAFGALAFSNSRNYSGSLAHWSNAVESSPRSAFAHKQLGTVYFLQRDFAKAQAHYQRALGLNPLEPMVHNNLGVVLLDQGALGAAEAAFRRELALNPGYDHALFNLGLIAFRTGRPQEAARLWHQSLLSTPDYLDAHRNLAVFYWMRRDYTGALRHAEFVERHGGQLQAELAKALASYRASRRQAEEH